MVGDVNQQRADYGRPTHHIQLRFEWEKRRSAVETEPKTTQMGSLTASTGGRRGSSRRGSRSSEYQAAAAAAQNHNRQDNYCHSATTSPYISVAVRVLESGSGRIGFNGVCTWCRESWHWLSSVVEQQCPPGWTSWVLAAGVATVGSLLSILWVLMDVVWIYSQLCSLTVPFFALMSGYLLLALGFRHSWTPTGIYLTFCGSVVGETVGFFLSSALESQVRLTAALF